MKTFVPYYTQTYRLHCDAAVLWGIPLPKIQGNPNFLLKAKVTYLCSLPYLDIYTKYI